MAELEFSQFDRAIWMSMANHFLDTDTRADIPHTALQCVIGGLSIEEAHAIWLQEVSPVVSHNLWLVAGEWAYWEEEWLFPRIEKRARRRRIARQDSWRAKLRNWFRPDLIPSVWKSIECCMRVLAQAPLEQRAGLASDLGTLAQCYFFDPLLSAAPDLARLSRLCELRDTVLAVLEPVTLAKERAETSARLARVLAEATSSARDGGAR
jgi:hypothetical protein